MSERALERVAASYNYRAWNYLLLTPSPFVDREPAVVYRLWSENNLSVEIYIYEFSDIDADEVVVSVFIFNYRGRNTWYYLFISNVKLLEWLNAKIHFQAVEVKDTGYC